MLAVNNARIEVYKPGSSTPDFEVPADDIQTVDASLKSGQKKDEGTIIINNDDGNYTQDDQQINSGDRLQFWITVEGYLGTWGSESWSDAAWGGELDRWDAMVRDRTMEYISPNQSDLKLKCEDFVFSVASKRRVYNTFHDVQAAGTDDSVLDTILANQGEEIGRDRIQPFTENVWFSWDGDTLFDAIKEIARRVDAVTRGRKADLVFKPLDDISPEFELAGSEIGRLKTKESDAGMVNRVRVDGGEASALEVEQPTQDTFASVTTDSRQTFQVTTRKSTLSHIEIWTNPSGNEEALTVRLQKDAGGSPIAIDDLSSDIVSKTLDSNFLANNGFTTFLLPDHDLPEPDPWIIIESDGENGQNVGTDSDGNVTHKTHYVFTITARNTSRSSRNKYRLREGRIKDNSIGTPEEAHDIAQDKLNHDSVPEHTVEAPADSSRTHHLKPLDVVTLDFSRERAVGDYMVVSRSDRYHGSVLETTLTMQEVSSI